jgi:hypothetical protein
MHTATTMVRLRQPEEMDDPLTEVLRTGARRLLAQAVEMEADAFLAAMQDLKLPDGRSRLVRHGHGPEREIQTGIGPVPGVTEHWASGRRLMRSTPARVISAAGCTRAPTSSTRCRKLCSDP